MAIDFDAFVSYGATDSYLVSALQFSLDGCTQPDNRIPAPRLFLDLVNPDTPANLSPETEQALAASQFFVLVASPESAHSEKVKLEIDWWIKHKSPQTLVIAQTSGADLDWDHATGNFNWDTVDALSPDLKETFSVEPLRFDLRSPSGAGAQDAVAAIATLAILFLNTEAVAHSQEIAAHATSQIKERLDLGLLLGLEALRTADTRESLVSLLTGLVANPQLARYLHGQPKLVRSVAWSSDGKLIAAAGADGAITVWNAETGQSLGPALAGSIGIPGVVFSPDSRILASYSDGGVVLWDVSDLRKIDPPLAHAGQPSGAHSLAFSPDGATLATVSLGQTGTVRLWDVATHEPIGDPLSFEQQLLVSAAFSPDGKTLAIGSRDGSILIWNLEEGSQQGPLLKGDDALNWLLFSPDGKIVAADSRDGVVILWDVNLGQELSRLVNEFAHTPAMFAQSYGAFSPDGTLFAMATTNWLDGFAESSGSGVQYWDVSDLRPVGPPLLEHGPDRPAVGFTSVAFSPDGSQLVTGTTNKSVLVWNVAPRQPLGPLVVDSITPRDAEGNMHAALSRDGALLATSAKEDNGIILWSIAEDRLQAALPGHGGFLSRLVFSPDGTVLGSAGRTIDQSSTVILWQIADGSQIATLTGDTGIGASLAFSPDGSILASAGGHPSTLVLWRVSDGQPIGSPLTGHDRQVEALVFSPDGRTLASSGGTTIFLWNAVDGQRRATLERHTDEVMSLAFSPDGSILASGGRDNVIRLWDVASGAPVGAPMEGHIASASGALGFTNAGVFALAFSDDGKTLASGGNDSEVRLWDFLRRQSLGPGLADHSSPISSVVFGKDNMTVVSVDWRNNVIVHKVDPDSWRSPACVRANRNLTEEEWERYLAPDPYQATCPDLAKGAGPAAAEAEE